MIQKTYTVIYNDIVRSYKIEGLMCIDIHGTYKFRTIPIALVATIILQELLGSLNFAACANLVPGGKLPYITATSFPLLSRERDTVNISFLLKQTMQSPGLTLFKESSVSFSISSSVNRYIYELPHFRLL